MGRSAANRGKLNERERRFVDAFLGKCAGNATQAYIAAGYAKTGADGAASRLLGKVSIQRAIAGRVKVLESRGILNAEQRDTILSDIARAQYQDVHARIRAISELNKSTGRHSMKFLHEGKLTLEQVLQQSREGEDA